MSAKAGQKRLKQIADALSAGKESKEDRQFIINAFTKIANGEDAKTALNVKAKRGERTSKAHQDIVDESNLKKRLAMGWIAAATAPEPEGFGLTLEEAIGRIGENGLCGFRYTEETLASYWNKNPDLREIEFTLPD